MKKVLKLLLLLMIMVLICQPSFPQINENLVKPGQIDGFGVNINTAWWYNGKYEDAFVVQPAIDMLIDSLGATIFRAVIEEMDWEKTNDDNDPSHFNWNYYNKVFSDARFQGVWNTLRYLNSRGIKKKLILSFMGCPPAAEPLKPADPKKSWMGATDYSVSKSMEDEFVESIAALLYYARYTAKIEFTLVSPMNETDVISNSKSADHPNGIVEGPNMPDAIQFVRVIKKLAKKLDAIGMSDIRFITPDAGGDRLFGDCLSEMVKDPYMMSKLAYWGVHDYGNNTRKYDSLINFPANTNKTYWVTETAGIDNMFGLLKGGAKAFMFWDGFDCVYQHARRNGYGDIPPNDWVFWQPDDGKPLLEYIPSTKSWKPRKQFYQFAKLFRSIKPEATKPEPDDWFAGDMHVHRNCGEGTSILAESELTKMMEPNDLSVISLLADMGDGEVKDSKTDLPKVNGSDAPQSLPGRMVHYDAEWHFDPAGTTFEHKALGGHLVILGLKEAHTIWDESPYKILEWGKKQNAIMGFCHMEYLKDSIPSVLDCCTPIDFPVEAALGTIDFLAEDVWLNDASIKAYYRLLNCGFRPGWAAGTDFPCNNSQPFGSLLTYVQVKDKPLTYSNWIEGIKNGRTVVTTNGHQEFLDLKVNGIATPGDEIKLAGNGNVYVEVRWISKSEQTGRIELVLNGKVIAALKGNSSPGDPLILLSDIPIKESSWICARRMDDNGHRSHTAAVYISLKNAPVRASAEDARYFVSWIDAIISNISPGGPWEKFFTHDHDIVRARYLKAKAIYEEIARESAK